MVDKYGFIGLGSQGGPMARAMIDAGLPTLLWARRSETLAAFAGSGAEFAESLPQLAARVQYLAICVVDDDGVRDICQQALPVMAAGSIIVIHSTVSPKLCIELAEQATAKGIQLVDAPVSGGGQGASNKTLTVMLGGEAEAVAAAKPVLEIFSGLIVHLGGVGAGQNAKLVNNAMMAANLAIAWQGIQASQRLNMERAAFIELVKASSGRSFAFDVGSRLPSPEHFEHGARLLAKDIGLLAASLGDVEALRVIRATADTFLKLALAANE